MTPCDICSRWPSSSSRSPGAAARARAARGWRSPAPAAELVNYQRNGGLAATLDTVTVRADGTTRADKRYGGAGRRFDDFRLSATDDGASTRGTGAPAGAARPPSATGIRLGATYLLRYRGRTYVAKQGAVPGRPASRRRPP